VADTALQEAHEADLAHAAQRFRSLMRSEEGPLDTPPIADFLMLMQRAGELAFADFAMGARRTEPQASRRPRRGATWIFGGPADALETSG
jgi:hypothetical protein